MEQQEIDKKTFLNISTKQIPTWITLCVFWFVQDNILAWLSIYNAKSPSYVPYKWLDYHFSALFFIPILFGIIHAVKNKRLWGFVLILSILVRSYFISQTQYGATHNMFYFKEYEIVLTLLVGVCLFEWFRNTINNEYYFSWSKFFLYFVFLHVISQFAAIVFSINKLTNRYNAINLDVETTGYLCGFAFVYFLTSGKSLKHRNLFLTLFMIGGLLSGSRTAFLLSLITLFIYWILKPKKSRITINAYLLICINVAVIIILLIMLIKPDYIETFVTTRLSALARVTNIIRTRSDSSVEGRSQSIMAGIRIIQKNPWGGTRILHNYKSGQIRKDIPHSRTLLSLPIIFCLGPLSLFQWSYIQFAIQLRG